MLMHYTITLLLLALPGALSQPESPRTSQPPSAVADNAVPPPEQQIAAQTEACNQRLDRIRAELKALSQSPLDSAQWGHRWAGFYRSWSPPHGSGSRYALAPNAGFVYIAHGIGGATPTNHGAIIESFDGGVVVDWAIDPAVLRNPNVSPRMYFLAWGDLTAFVSDERLTMLVNELNAGGSGRDTISFLAVPVPDGQVRKSVPAVPEVRPQLPASWASRLFDHRVEVNAMSYAPTAWRSEDGQAQKYAVTIEGGTDKGLWVGMSFPLQVSHASGKLVLDEVNATSSRGTLVVWADAGERPEAPPVGQIFAIPGTKLPPATK